MSLQNLKIRPARAQNIEMLESLLLEAGALSVMLEDAEDNPVFEPLPDEVILWEKTMISAIFPADVVLDAFVAKLKKEYPDSDYQLETLIEKNWEKVWLEKAEPLCFQNYLWVCPSVCEPPVYDQPIVRLDPGLAFGTGTHPTTALCLDYLAANPPKDEVIIDYGCGSGILAIAALKLGAKKVYAVDHDAQALQATKNNAVLNQIDANTLVVLMPDEFCGSQLVADVLLANILANPLIELAGYFATRLAPQRKIILSGILTSQLALIFNAYQPYFDSLKANEKEGWLVVTGFRKASLDVPIANVE